MLEWRNRNHLAFKYPHKSVIFYKDPKFYVLWPRMDVEWHDYVSKIRTEYTVKCLHMWIFCKNVTSPSLAENHPGGYDWVKILKHRTLFRKQAQIDIGSIPWVDLLTLCTLDLQPELVINENSTENKVWPKGDGNVGKPDARRSQMGWN